MGPRSYKNQQEVSNALVEPFSASDLEWRVQRAGARDNGTWALIVPYITNRAIQERLDDVFGVLGWGNEFKEGPCGGILCGITVYIDSAEITKWDGAENTDIEPVKGGLSGAMKRAAVQFGIGRYLYSLDTCWATCFEDTKKGAHRGQWIDSNKQKHYFSYNPPELPESALPIPLITKEQRNEILKMAIDLNCMEEIEIHYNVGDLSEIRANQYESVMKKLRATEKKQNENIKP